MNRWRDYYEPKSDFTAEYLKVLGVEKKEPSRAYLNQLILAHQSKIPISNLSAVDDEEASSLRLDDIYRKVLVERRGGNGFELNSIFSSLLEKLGFTTWLSPCRNLKSTSPYPEPISHCCVIVNLTDDQFQKTESDSEQKDQQGQKAEMSDGSFGTSGGSMGVGLDFDFLGTLSLEGDFGHKMYVDVGYPHAPAGALEIKAGEEQKVIIRGEKSQVVIGEDEGKEVSEEHAGSDLIEKFQFEDSNRFSSDNIMDDVEQLGWYTLIHKHPSNPLLDRSVLLVSKIPCFVTDFIGPDQLVTEMYKGQPDKRKAAIRTGEGYKELAGDEITIQESGMTSKIKIMPERFHDMMKLHFGIEK